MAWTSVKIAMLAPRPSAKVRTAIVVKPGRWARRRAAIRRSAPRLSMDTSFFDGLDSWRVAEASCIVDADEVLVEAGPVAAFSSGSVDPKHARAIRRGRHCH